MFFVRILIEGCHLVMSGKADCPRARTQSIISSKTGDWTKKEAKHDKRFTRLDKPRCSKVYKISTSITESDKINSCFRNIYGLPLYVTTTHVKRDTLLMVDQTTIETARIYFSLQLTACIIYTSEERQVLLELKATAVLIVASHFS